MLKDNLSVIKFEKTNGINADKFKEFIDLLNAGEIKAAAVVALTKDGKVFVDAEGDIVMIAGLAQFLQCDIHDNINNSCQ